MPEDSADLFQKVPTGPRSVGMHDPLVLTDVDPEEDHGKEERNAMRSRSGSADARRHEERTSGRRPSAGREKSVDEGRPVVEVDTTEHVNDMQAGQSNILVAVRARGLLPHEKAAGGKSIIRVLDGKVAVLLDPGVTAADDYLRLNKSREKRYAFDHVFDESASQELVFNNTTQFLIGGVLNGYSATVFSYGATGAGKTYTMLGSYSQPGIMGLTLHSLFVDMEREKGEKSFEIKASFLEVYNENLRDLLSSNAASNDYLDLREDPVKGMCVAGISEVSGLASAEEILELLDRGNRNRTTEPTAANVTSSRSHAVLQIVVEQRERTADLVSEVQVGKLSMIDLAGSERASQTNNRGIRMLEGANINRSLLALGNCITALADRTHRSAASFVPYRDSKLTRLLKDSLGGNCRTVMIANVGPCHANYEDTHNTLKYANRAKNIKTKPVRSVLTVAHHIEKYTQIIQELRAEVTALKGRVKQVPPPEVPRTAIDERGRKEQEESEAWKSEVLENFEERVQLKRSLIELENNAQQLMVARGKAQVSISQCAAEGEDNAEQQGILAKLKEQLRHINQQLANSNAEMTDRKARLAENMKALQHLEDSLPHRVKNQDLRAFLQLIYRVQALQIEHMALEDANQGISAVLKHKDLEIEKLKLQIRLRDKMLEEQSVLLSKEQRDRVPKHANYLPCKTEVNFDGLDFENQLSGRLAAAGSAADGSAERMPVPGPQALRGAAHDAAFLRAQALGPVPGQVDELPPRPRAFLPEVGPASGRRHEGSSLPRLRERDRSHERERSHDRRSHERSHSPIRLPDIHLSTRETSDRDLDSSPDARPRGDTSPSSSNLEGSSRRRDRSEPRTERPERSDVVRRRERERDENRQDERDDRERRRRPYTGRVRSPVQEERAIEEALRGEPRLRADGFQPPQKKWGSEKPPRAYLPYISPSKAPVGPKLGVPATGRFARHRKRGNRRPTGGVHPGGTRFGHGPHGPRGRQPNYIWQPKERSNLEREDGSLERRDESSERRPPPDIPRKDIIRKLNQDFEARKAAQEHLARERFA